MDEDPERTIREPMDVPPGGLDDATRRDRDAAALLDAAVVGAIVYLLVGVGAFLALTFMATIGENATIAFGFGQLQGGGDQELFLSAVYAYSELTLLAVPVGVGLGVYAAEIDSAGVHPAAFAGVATLVGAFVTLLLLLAVAVSAGPAAIDLDVGEEFLGLLGAVVAATFAGTITAGLFHARRT